MLAILAIDDPLAVEKLGGKFRGKRESISVDDRLRSTSVRVPRWCRVASHRVQLEIPLIKVNGVNAASSRTYTHAHARTYVHA